MENTINKFNNNLWVIFLSNIISLTTPFSYFTPDNRTEMDYHYWLNTITLFILTLVLYRVLKKYNEMRLKTENLSLKTELLSMIAFFRHEGQYISKFDNVTFYRLPNESDEDLFKRMPNGMFLEELQKEYLVVKTRATEYFDKKPSEIQALMDEIYGIKNNK